MDPTVDPQGQGMDDETKQRLLQAMLVAGQSQGQGGQQVSEGAQQAATPSTPIQQTADQMSATPATPPTSPQPNVTLAHASLDDQPATQYVNKAQGALDQYQDRPMWKKMLGPGLIALASTLGAHSRNGLKLQEMAQQDQTQLGQMAQQRQQSLVNQVAQSRGLQQQEYEADQRNRQQDILMAGNNQTKTLMAQIAAGSRENVAGTAAQSRRDVANTNVQGREIVAGTQGDTARDVAGIRGGFQLQVAKINATAALNRFLAGQGRQDARQQAGFAHADLKPTADEDRRADLSEAMIGYAGMLKDIATRRPELFGNMSDTAGGLLQGKLQGGRMTQLRQSLGTDDPDVGELKFLKEQLGITQMGAHSLRSAQAISPIADSLVNAFNNSADVVISNADAAIKGVSQFTGPQARPTAFYPGGSQTNINPPGSTPGQSVTPRRPLTSQVDPPRPAGVPSNAVWNGAKRTWQLPQPQPLQ